MEQPSATVELFFEVLGSHSAILAKIYPQIKPTSGKKSCGPGKITGPSGLKSLLAIISQYISKGVTLTRHSL